jgi:hypothetical protein
MSLARIRRPLLALAALALPFLAGCTHKTTQGNATIYAYDWWVPVGGIVGGLALIGLGVGMFVWMRRWVGGVVFVVLGLILAVFLSSLVNDRVVVDEAHFLSIHGTWWERQAHDVRFADLRDVTLVVEKRTGRRGTSSSYSFDCARKSGGVERVPLGDLMKEALPEILAHFRANRVPVLGLDQLT